ncbi:MAG: type II toxin-antitoxin system RelE/ParE family toxin [Bacteroidales bacterium]|jgi:mRNA-degrading endonuclease RelE of RelBE toxin-antitoxin system|nr:type II toxin-antitoxin system RelE/ParE family toxin [Bacteroidales bacterium]
MYQFFYLDEVENDITQAKSWYAEQQKGLDSRFSNAITETLYRIVKMPMSYCVRYRNVRIAHTKIFPYNIHFYIDDVQKRIVIIGIVHNKRNDAVLLER